ncbi:MFS transporter [Glutamicibacter sp. AOP38-B1-38]|uniref:MFS transporter n=1 Tax=Glutamicibacter sp. AOP38-B1-38 TaxID=3457680 RepID=UPI004034A590
MSFTGHEPHSVPYRGMLLALFASGVATFSQLYSVQGLLPSIAVELNISSSQAALTVSAATLGLALAVTPWAIVSDRIGRRRVIAIALLASVVLGLASSMMSGFEPLLVVRFLEGIALAGVPGSALAYLADELTPRAVALASGTYISGTTLGGLAGRLVASWVGEPAGWRWGVAAVSVMAALGTLFFLLKAPAALGFTPIEQRGLRPILGKFKRALGGGMPLLYLQGFLLMGGFVAVYNYLAFRLEAPPFMVPVSLASLVFIAYLSGTWSAVASGRLVAKAGRRGALLLSIVLSMAGLLLTLSGNLVAIIAGMVIFTAGFFAAHAVASGWVPVLAPATRAQAASLYNLFYYVGSSLLGWLIGIPFMHYGWPTVVLCVVLLQILAVIFALGLKHKR